MRYLLAVAIMCLSGCAVFRDPAPWMPERQQTFITFELTEDLPADRAGQALVADGFCTIKLRPSVYPSCIKHEVMHCFGWKHDERPNSEYCNDE